MAKNKASWMKLYRKELTVRLKGLSDTEVLLLLHYASVTDWDKKHANYGTLRKTVRAMKRDQLPSWSIGKINRVTNSLIAKGFLSRLDDSRIRVENYWLYRADESLAERAYRLAEQNVLFTEHDVLNLRQSEFDDVRSSLKNMWKMR